MQRLNMFSVYFKPTIPCNPNLGFMILILLCISVFCSLSFKANGEELLSFFTVLCYSVFQEIKKS